MERVEVLTVVHYQRADDLAVTIGTTVAELRARLGWGQTDLVTTSDGRTINAEAAVGVDLAPGTTLVVLPSKRMVWRSRGGSSEVTDEAGLPGWVSLAVAYAMGIMGILIPLVLGQNLIPDPLRWALMAVLVMVATSLMWTPVVQSAAGAVILPGLAGLAATGWVSPTAPWAVNIGGTTGLCVALVAAVMVWLAVGTTAAAASIGIWACVAVGGVLLGGLNLPGMAIIPWVLAAGPLLLYILPTFAVPVPASQLVDTPLLAVSAVGVHQPAMEAPRRVLGRWASDLARNAQGLSDVISISVGVLLGLAALGTIGRVPSDLRGVFVYVTLICSVLLLWLVPQTAQTRLTRVMPRVVAVVIYIVMVINLLVAGLGLGWAALAGAAGLVIGIMLFGVFRADRRLPMLERLNEIVTALVIVVITPAACVASGLFFWVWEVMS
jgi:hypothetical protein